MVRISDNQIKCLKEAISPPLLLINSTQHKKILSINALITKQMNWRGHSISSVMLDAYNLHLPPRPLRQKWPITVRQRVSSCHQYL